MDRDELAGSAVPDLPSWWSDGGWIGWNPGVWLGNSPPWSLAGLSLGGWSLEEPGRAPQGLPFPGVSGVQTPIVWYDSVAVAWGEGAAWRGFGATLGTAYGLGRKPGRGGARSILDLRNGSFNYDENALSIERGDSLAWFRGEATSGSRGEVEALLDQGRHLWGMAGGLRRGRHEFEGTFAQRAASAGIHSLDEEAASGQSGSIDYRYSTERDRIAVSLARGLDYRESMGISRDVSRRDAQETVIMGEARRRLPEQELAMRVVWRRTLVTRSVDPYFERGSDAGWLATRWDRSVSQGRLRLELGAGRHAALEAFELAPGVSYRMESGQLGARVGLERLLFPVWADLAPGQEAFLQRTWAGSFDLHVAGAGGSRVEAGLLLGRTSDRALVTRMPLDDLWLRLGARADRSPYDFALLTLDARWHRGRLGAGVSGFGLARRQDAAVPALDPGAAGLLWGAVGFTAFKGDLGVSLRAQLEGVGQRESEGAPPGVCSEETDALPRSLPGYFTSGVTVAFSLVNSIITIRVRNLENQRREEIWHDCERSYVDEQGVLQFGREALGPGREWRFALTSRLLN